MVFKKECLERANKIFREKIAFLHEEIGQVAIG